MESNRFLTAENVKINTVKLATDIFKALTELKKSHKDKTTKEWHDLVINKYPDFSKTHPTVIRFMTHEEMFLPEVFTDYLNKLETIQGKGNEVLINLQGDYAKKLYIEFHKKQGKRYNMHTANTIRRNLIQHMMQFYNDAKKKEEEVKSEFAEKNAEYLVERKQELLQFVKTNRDSILSSLGISDVNDPEIIEDTKMIARLGKNDWSAKDIEWDEMPPEELVSEIKKYEDDLLWFMNKLNEIQEQIETLSEEQAAIDREKREREHLRDTNLGAILHKKVSNRERKRRERASQAVM